VSWLAKIRKVTALGAVITTGLLAGAFLSVSSAKERKPKHASPATAPPPDAGVADGKPASDQPRAKRAKAKVKPDADKVRRAQPLPRDYVE
jgi:hypothetical protein